MIDANFKLNYLSSIGRLAYIVQLYPYAKPDIPAMNIYYYTTAFNIFKIKKLICNKFKKILIIFLLVYFSHYIY